jgi:hypothetical protein
MSGDTGNREYPDDSISRLEDSKRPFAAGKESKSWLEAASTPL